MKMNSYSRGMNSRNRHLGRHAWAYRCVAPDGGAVGIAEGKPWDRQPVSGRLRRKLGVSPGFARKPALGTADIEQVPRVGAESPEHRALRS